MSLFFRSFATLCSIIIFTASSQTSAVPFVWEDVEGSPLQIGRPVGASARTPAVIRWEGLTEKGEPIHFALEPLANEDCRIAWRLYCSATLQITEPKVLDLDYCYQPMPLVDPFFFRRFKDGWSESWIQKGFKDSQFQEHKKAAEERSRTYSSQDSFSYEKVRHGLSAGFAGMSIKDTAYVAYASSQPIEGYFHTSTPTLAALVDEVKTKADKSPYTGYCIYDFVKTSSVKDDVGHYAAAFGHLQISVSLYPKKFKPHQEVPALHQHTWIHRGIARNPWSALMGGYKGLALLLHSFGATAYCLQHPEAEVMNVNTDGLMKMTELLYRGFDPNAMLIVKKDQLESWCFPDVKKSEEKRMGPEEITKLRDEAKVFYDDMLVKFADQLESRETHPLFDAELFPVKGCNDTAIFGSALKEKFLGFVQESNARIPAYLAGQLVDRIFPKA